MTAQLNEKEEWLRIRQIVKGSAEINDEWKLAFNLFEKRIKDRYFKPIKYIIEQGEKIGEGFAIVSLQCSLIETFASFRGGKISEELAKNYFEEPYTRYSDFYYDNVGIHYSNFLTSANIFNDIFYSLQDGNPRPLRATNFAISFYQDVRCALLHDCMTRNGWIINTIPEKKSDGVMFIERKEGKKYIYRTLFQNALERYLTSYLNELTEETRAGQKMRKKFARRYDFTHEIKHDNAIWWEI